MATFTGDLLQFDPKGTYYEAPLHLIAAHDARLSEMVRQDRRAAALFATLPGTHYARGRLISILLSTKPDSGLIEQDVVLGVLEDMGVTRAVKVLVALAAARVNNERVRLTITRWLFDRSVRSMVEIALRYRKKVLRILRHCASPKELRRWAENGIPDGMTDGRFPDAKSDVLRFLLGLDPVHSAGFKKFRELRDLARGQKAREFMDLLGQKPDFPYEIALGFRNTFGLPITQAELMELTRFSDRQRMLLQGAAERAGAVLDVDYAKQPLYELWKLYFMRTMARYEGDLAPLKAAIDKKSCVKLDLDLGTVCVVFDMSGSMYGSAKRPFHPLLVATTITAIIAGLGRIFYVGGVRVKGPGRTWAMAPFGASNLGSALAQALAERHDSVLVISDGYENVVPGLCDYVLREARRNGVKSRVMHLNPVVSATGEPRRLFRDVEPVLVTDGSFLKTVYVCGLWKENREEAEKLMMGEYRKMLGKMHGEVEFLLT